MSDSPALIGRHRISQTDRARGLGTATPVSTRGGRDDAPLFVPKTEDELRRDREESRDAQPLVTLCGLCEWRFEGTAGAGREAARLHREEQHPEAAAPRGRRGRRSGWVKPRTEQSKLDAAEANRVRAEREDADRLAKVERARARDALVAMDDGVQQPEPMLEETAAVGQTAVSGSAPVVREPERAAASSSSGHRFGLKKFGRGYIWTREAAIAAVREYHEAVGRAPSLNDAKREPVGQLPSQKSAADLFGGWPQLLKAAGYEPLSTHRRNGLGRAATSAPTPRPDESAARPAESEREPQTEDAPDIQRPVSSPPSAEEDATSRSEPLLAKTHRYLTLRREVDRLEAELLAELEQELAA